MCYCLYRIMIWLRFRLKKRWLKGKKKLKGIINRRWWKLFMFCNLITFVTISAVFLFSYLFFAPPSPTPSKSVFDGTGSQARIDVGRSVCRVPKINPFHKSVIKLVRERLPALQCESNRYLIIFKETVNPSPALVPLHPKGYVESHLGISECCYRTIASGPGGLNTYQIGTSQCYTVYLDKRTEIPAAHPFILVECLVNGVSQVMDAHAFVSMKPESSGSSAKVEGQLNVIIIGLSSVSRASFIRSMPKSYTFLIRKLSPLDFKAYHSIGDDKTTNIGSLLSSVPLSRCQKNGTFDDCPFIWKRFEKAGYKTLFAEDQPSHSIFKKAFLRTSVPPTQYYPLPFFLGAASELQKNSSTFCLGPRPSFQVMLEYLQSMASVMTRHQKPFFQFAWSSSLTDHHVNGGQWADTHLHQFLEWFHQNDYFKNTVFILLSDQGIKSGPLHRPHSSDQSYFEERLPFLFFLVPPNFTMKDSLAFTNLFENTPRLMTTLDVYQTLEHLLNSYEKMEHGNTEVILKNMNGNRNRTSLFLPISPFRNCEFGGVPKHLCACNIRIEEISVEDTRARSAANQAVEEINELIYDHPRCKPLSLSKVWKGGIILRNGEFGGNNESGIRVHFATEPGNGNFVATAAQVDGKGFGGWSVSGFIGRTDMNFTQNCVDDETIKFYCFCFNDTKVPT